MPRITARQHRQDVKSLLIAIAETQQKTAETQQKILTRLDGLATAARVGAVLDQLAALGASAGEGQDITLGRLQTIGAQVDAITASMSHLAAAAQAAAGQPAEAPAAAAEAAPPARPAARRGNARAK